jgi:hypothetical protein
MLLIPFFILGLKLTSDIPPLHEKRSSFLERFSAGEPSYFAGRRPKGRMSEPSKTQK